MDPDSIKEDIFSIFKRGPVRTFKLKNTSEKSGFANYHYFCHIYAKYTQKNVHA